MKTARLVSVTLLAFAVAALPRPALGQGNEMAFLEAAGSGDLGMVTALLDLGMNPNVADTAGNTALMYAAGNGHAAVVSKLLEKGASVDATTGDGWTALALAALNGHAEALQTLLANGAAVDASPSIGLTPLMMAAVKGHAEAVGILMDHHAAAGATTPDGRTALMAAAEGGYADVVQVLLEKGADPNQATPNGWTAATTASQRGDRAIMKLLGEHGAVFSSGVDSVPQLLSNPDFEFPDSLAEAGIEGKVVVELVVGTDGKVEPASFKILESPHPALEEPVRNVFLAAEYKPAQLEGMPVRMRIRQSVNVGS